MIVLAATKRILIVDDEDHVREVVQTCLETLGGWEVLPAKSALEGLSIVANEQLDAIVLDVQMPGMSGLSFLQRIRTNPQTQTLPVVLLTAHIDLTQPSLLTQLKIAKVIVKPFDSTLLHQQVAQAVGWI